MVNSASQALSEFKSQRMGGLLSGYSSTVAPPTIAGSSLSDTASDRMARSAPKKSTTAFMDQIRQSGKRMHETAMMGAQQRMGGASGNAGYSLPNKPGARPAGANGTVAYGGRYGLQKNASAALTRLEAAYQRAWGSGFIVNSGWRSYEDQVKAKIKESQGGSRAATPGTSIHGWGNAVDLGGPILNAGSKQHAWLRQNAATFGWYWVGQRYGEPWHWEYHPEWK